MLTSGTLSLTTGAVTSGKLGSGVLGNVVTFGAGNFNITTTGWQGFSGALFTGSISGIDWIYTGKSGNFYDYTLTGFVSGIWGPSGATVSGQTAQLFFHSKTLYTGGPISLSSGTTGIVVPEPASLGLTKKGLLALGMLVRRKSKNGRG